MTAISTNRALLVGLFFVGLVVTILGIAAAVASFLNPNRLAIHVFDFVCIFLWLSTGMFYTVLSLSISTILLTFVAIVIDTYFTIADGLTAYNCAVAGGAGPNCPVAPDNLTTVTISAGISAVYLILAITCFFAAATLISNATEDVGSASSQPTRKKD